MLELSPCRADESWTVADTLPHFPSSAVPSPPSPFRDYFVTWRSWQGRTRKWPPHLWCLSLSIPPRQISRGRS